MIIIGYKLRLEEEFSQYSESQIKEFFNLFNIEIKYEIINGYLTTLSQTSISNNFDKEFSICIYFKDKCKSNFPMSYYTIKGEPGEIFEKFQKYKEINAFI